MGLGKILGSISPAFGMLSGKGLFGQLPLNAIGQSGLGGILGLLLSHGAHGGDAPAQAAPAPAPVPGGPGIGGAAPLGYSGPSVGQQAGSLPTMAPGGGGPSTINKLGSALAQSSGGGDMSAGLSASQAPLIQHGNLQAILQSLGLM